MSAPGDGPPAPGTILQHLYVRERLRRLPRGRFVEVGVGDGRLSELLLGMGWRGAGWELSAVSAANARRRLAGPIEEGRYALHHGDWLEAPLEPADLVISSMVVEHLPDEAEARYLARCRDALGPEGLAVLLVPASPAHWGVEDDIAGHLRRYTADGLRRRLAELGLAAEHVAGLTFPLSNMLLPVSNRLVERAEADRRSLSARERTERSGHRSVPMKTAFPAALGLLLNERTLYPFHLLQKAARGLDRCLVLYAEARPTARPAPGEAGTPLVDSAAS